MSNTLTWEPMAEAEDQLRCVACRNPLMLVIQQPVARKVHKRNAHRLRVVATCPLCGNTQRITRGPAN